MARGVGGATPTKRPPAPSKSETRADHGGGAKPNQSAQKSDIVDPPQGGFGGKAKKFAGGVLTEGLHQGLSGALSNWVQSAFSPPKPPPTHDIQ